MKKDLLSVKDLTVGEIQDLFTLTDQVKKDKIKFAGILKGKTLALIFQKPSCRTRVSFEVGFWQLGGYSLCLGPDELNLGVRESIQDAAKTLSRYVDGIVLRTFEHKNIIEMAKSATIPVINGLSDLLHPCQALGDVYTLREKLKDIKGITLAYIGDGNNVCNSLLYTCSKLGLNMNIATPKGYEPGAKVLKEAKSIARSSGSVIKLFHDPPQAAKSADVIYTDVWASMGQEKQAKERKRLFKKFQVNKQLVKFAKKEALIMHCLPAHRGDEITDEVIDSRNSVVFDQAENRMHVQKAVLIKLLGD